MKKFLICAILAIGATTVLGGCTGEKSDIAQLQEIVEHEVFVTPERPADMSGVIATIAGNAVILKSEIGKEILSEEEQAAQQAARKSMTQEERQALRASEQEARETEDVTVTIPVGTLIMKGSGLGDGASVKATFDDLQEGVYISLWMNGDAIEAIKIKGL